MKIQVGIFALLFSYQALAANADAVAQAEKADALQLAAIEGRTEDVRTLLQMGVTGTNDLWSALMYAVAGGSAPTVQAILDSKPDVNFATADGTTAIQMAAVISRPDLMKMLYAAGAQATATDSSPAPALLAWKAGCYQCVFDSQNEKTLKFDPKIQKAQKLLQVAGLPVAADGYPKLSFLLALSEYQQARNLPGTAMPDPKTMAALRRPQASKVQIEDQRWLEPPRLTAYLGPFEDTQCKIPAITRPFYSEAALSVTVDNAGDVPAIYYGYDPSQTSVVKVVEVPAHNKATIPIFSGQFFAFVGAQGECVTSGWATRGDEDTQFAFH